MVSVVPAADDAAGHHHHHQDITTERTHSLTAGKNVGIFAKEKMDLALIVVTVFAAEEDVSTAAVGEIWVAPAIISVLDDPGVRCDLTIKAEAEREEERVKSTPNEKQRLRRSARENQ